MVSLRVEQTQHTLRSPAKGTVLVVGASRGIGLATSVKLARSGYSVVGWSRSGDLPTEKGQPIDGLWSQSVDVRSLQEIEAGLEFLAENVGSPQTIVYSAGIAGRGRLGEIDAAEWRDAFETNAFGAFAVLDRYFRIFRRHPLRVIGLTSDAALAPSAARSAYGVSKAALSALLEAYRQETRPMGTTVTLLYLGQVNTTLSTRSAGENARALQPREVAEVVSSLVELPRHIEVRSLQLSSVASAYRASGPPIDSDSTYP